MPKSALPTHNPSLEAYGRGRGRSRGRGRGRGRGSHSCGRGRSNKHRGNNHQKATKTSSLKHQIRGITRMLKRDNLPTEMRQNMERKLRILEKKRSWKAQQQVDKRTKDKLRKVFFIERTKVKRKIKSLEKQIKLVEEPEKKQKVKEELDQYLKIMDYIVNFPMKQEAYIPYLAESKLIQDWRSRRDEMMDRIQKDVRGRSNVQETIDGFVTLDERQSDVGDKQKGAFDSDEDAFQARTSDKLFSSPSLKHPTKKHKISRKKRKREKEVLKNDKKGKVTSSGESGEADEDAEVDDFFVEAL